MSCLYQDCTHNVFEHDCSFRPFPSNDCQFRIWKRYASCSERNIKRSRIPSLCSCHFVPGNEYPIPYYEYKAMKRKQSSNQGVNEWVNELVAEQDNGRVNKRTNESHKSKIKYRKIYRGKYKTEQIDCRKVIIYEDLVNAQNACEIDLSTMVKTEKINTFPEVEDAEILDLPNNRLTGGDYTIFEVSEVLQPSAADDTIDDVICTSDLIEKEIIEIKDDPVPIHHSPKVMTPTFGYDMIENSDEQFFTYTGLPSKEMFDSVFDTLCQLEFNYVDGWNVSKIPMKNQLLMTLMKIRLDLRLSGVANRFKCSESTVSNIVRSWMVVMKDIIFLHEMKDIPTAERRNEELSACRIVEEMVRIEIENTMKYKH